MIDFNYEKKYALIELKEYAGYCEEFEMRIIKNNTVVRNFIPAKNSI